MRRTFLFLAVLAAGPVQAQDDFDSWLGAFRQDARAQGISPATLDAALSGVEPNERVIELDRRQPEFLQTFSNYLERRVTPAQVARGQDQLEQHAALLDAVEQKYGIPKTVLVAFWGLETNYGGYLGNHPVPLALATLAFDPRRGAFFRGELLQALRIIDAGHVAAADMKGSWAGAMGQVQFMPSTYLRYAVDGDGDGRKDLWASLPDALNSAAHFLSELGWRPGERWGREVLLPESFDWDLARPGVKKRVDEWAALGVLRADGDTLPDSDMQGAIVLPQGHAGPAFLVYRNFEVMMAWNRSINYALAVGHLSDRLLALPPLLGGGDADNRPMSREQVLELQQLLATRGFDIGEADGVAGPRTRQAIRAWQKVAGLPADGHASPGVLEEMRAKAAP